jgi:hypothetical protein
MILRFSDTDDEPSSHRQFDTDDSIFVIDSDSDTDLPNRVCQIPWRAAPEPATYRFLISSHFTLRGIRTHYQLFKDGYPLFHSKSKSWHPSAPYPISPGSSTHFSHPNFIAFVVPSPARRAFAVKQGQDTVMTVQFTQMKGVHPKTIRISIGNEIFVSQAPKKGEGGHWCLSFGGKLAIPSVKNCVIVSETDPESIVMQMRRISTSNCELDSAGVFPPVCLFAYAIATFVSPI